MMDPSPSLVPVGSKPPVDLPQPVEHAPSVTCGLWVDELGSTAVHVRVAVYIGRHPGARAHSGKLRIPFELLRGRVR